MAVIVYGSLTVRLVLLIIKITVESRDLKAYKCTCKQGEPLCIEAEITEITDVERLRYDRYTESVITLTYEVNGHNYKKEVSLHNSSGFHRGGKIELICDPADPARAALKNDDSYRDIKSLIQYDIAQIIITVIFFAVCAITFGIKISFEV